MLLFGALAIAGIISIQSYLIIKTWDIQDQDFDQNVRTVLYNVAQEIARYNNDELPKTGLIQRRSSNYYSVNVNSAIDANILEDYLYQELVKHSLAIDFQYAVYDCANDELVMGNYCKLSPETQDIKPSTDLPRFEDLIYYFVVGFPSKESYLLSNMWQTILFSIIAFLAVIFFIYAIWIILRQKQLTELQKDFINNMTHEFKTPISSIKLAADVLIGNDKIKGESRLLEYSNIIKEQNKRLNDQVEKVLNIARVENDHFELHLEEAVLDRELKKIYDSENIKFTERRGELVLKLNCGDSKVKMDPLHFNNIISNLLDNALKYCTNKPLTVIESKVQDGKCLITIEDNGIGIKEDEQKKLFSKFYRVPTGNVHDVKGFGLGLFYVKNICKRHQWGLDLESEFGKGTTISISIPLLNDVD